MNKHLISLAKSTLKGQGTAAHEDINLIGTPAEIVDKANAFREAGVTHLLGLYFAANSVQELLDQMQIFGEEVTPKVKGSRRRGASPFVAPKCFAMVWTFQVDGFVQSAAASGRDLIMKNVPVVPGWRT